MFVSLTGSFNAVFHAECVWFEVTPINGRKPSSHQRSTLPSTVRLPFFWSATLVALQVGVAEVGAGIGVIATL